MRTHLCEIEGDSIGNRVTWCPVAVIVGISVGLLIVSWLFPPFRAMIGGDPATDQSGAGFRFILDGQGPWSDFRTFEVDWRSLFIVDLMIATATATALGFAWSFRKNSPEYGELWQIHITRRRLKLQALAVGLGFAGLAVSWLFPPWTAILHSRPHEDQRGAGLRYVFRRLPVWSDHRQFVIDWRTLAIIDLGILLATASAVVSIRSEVE